VQAESTLGDVFSAGVSSPRGILQSSLKAIGERGSGVLLYLRRPHIEAEITRNQESTPPVTSSIVMREYGIGAQILRDLGVSQIELLTSMTRPLVGLPSFGLTIVAQHPLIETGSPSEISL
jgi:3,4-dihydroxy 2-butanone 4-phosphate synthase/GTP cyclohydrolase II